MAFVTLALVLVPCLIAGEESALAWGEREWQPKVGHKAPPTRRRPPANGLAWPPNFNALPDSSSMTKEP